MFGSQRFREIEIKLRVSNLREIHKTLRRVRAREISPRTYELNTLYDTPAQDLRRLGRLIRVRVEHVPGDSKRKREQGHAVLTYKAPVRSSKEEKHTRAAVASRSRFKVKQEAEVSVTGADQMDRILRGLGLRPTFRYEKYRTTYLLPGIKDLKIELDETPVGDYLELEGSPASIDRAASRLGYAPADYIQATYGALHLADCRRRGRKPGHMLFPNAKNLR
jgi:adenylate cyclase class 2